MERKGREGAKEDWRQKRVKRRSRTRDVLSGIHTEKDILEDDGLLRQAAKVADCGRRGFWVGLLLDARPCQVDVEEQQEDA